MPANLPPQYLEAEKRYREARTTPEKLDTLKEMLSLLPKHKGTEKLQADLKRKFSKLRKEKKREPARRGYGFKVEREGAGQVVLVGPPNVGKSQLLAKLTNANPEVAEYAFTTRKPLPGMILYEDIQIQLIDLPPIAHGFMEPWLPTIIRNADLILLLIDLGSKELLEEIEGLIEELGRVKLKLMEKGSFSPTSGEIQKKALLVGNKKNLPGAEENYEALQDLYSKSFSILPISAKDGDGLDELKRKIFESLDIIRVYTKAPGRKPDLAQPFILKMGSTLLDLASLVHKDFMDRLKYARIWGEGSLKGEMVPRNHILQDKDVVELHL